MFANADRLIKVRDRVVIISKKRNKFKKALESYQKKREEVMQTEVKRIIEKDGLTGAESIYMAFKQNNWIGMRGSELRYSTGKPPGTISAIISSMQKNDILMRTEKEPRKFYYTVPEALQGIGSVGWNNMFKEIRNANSKKTRKEKTKKQKPSVTQKAKKAKVVNALIPTPTSTEDILAKEIRKHLNSLNASIEKAHMIGLTVDITLPDHLTGYNVKVYKEF